MQNAQQQKRIDELLAQMQALVAQVQALSGQMTTNKATEQKEEDRPSPPQQPTLEQLRSLQEEDGSVTVEDPQTKESINYVLLPEESETCVIAHPWAYAASLKQQTNFKPISGANNLCFWRCVAHIMTDYRTDNTLHKLEDVKQEILDWAIRQAYQVAALLDGETLAVTKQLKADRKAGAMATEKSVASAALYLGLRLTVLHEDMAQAWAFLGEAGNPVGPAYILKLKNEHFTLGQQVDIQPHVLHGASWRFGQLPSGVQLQGGKQPQHEVEGPWLEAIRKAKPLHRPRQGTGTKLTPWHFLHTNANNWNGAQKALEAAQYEHAVDVLTVAEHRRRGIGRCQRTQPGAGMGSLCRTLQKHRRPPPCNQWRGQHTC
eukprot:5064381-Amphidinium_carterae.1